MTDKLHPYNEQVSVYTTANHLLGKATFSGKALRTRKYGNWKWHGILIKTDFDASTVIGKSLMLMFSDGIMGKVNCMPSPTNKPGIVDVTGVGTPPRID